MNIEGPFRIGVVDNPDGIGRELHFDFTPVFQALDLDGRTAQLSRYVAELRAQAGSASANTREHQGMLVVLQLAETLLPHVAADEIPLGETIVVEMAPGLSVSNLLATSH